MSLQGRKNRYECPDCGRAIVTIDRDEGSTPMLLRCGNGHCDGMMRSSFYASTVQPLVATHAWVKGEHPEILVLMEIDS